MTGRLEAAQAELAAATAERQAAERARMLEQLAEVRKELRAAQARSAVLGPRVKLALLRQQQIHHELEALLFEDSDNHRPAVADLLPDDDEVVAWRKRKDAIQAKRAALVAERDRLPDPEELAEANALAGANGKIATLEFAQRNLLNALEGRSGKAWVR